ncbi:GntR family transcriptional regulator [Humitalea rosea]|uniref:GntR family transcriptional regulator n=1 Tax=Humitalea rosea TaxID=990373 RepID=A0A2W7IN59_9PROT|nr:GntR family transcriptional regulator [Humitalea rosea]PZW48393.1 GntR family transcriptional regulator [Humitalea rosea]
MAADKKGAGVTAAERVRAALEQDLLGGALTPGMRLDEMDLATRFAVSRTPVREALKALAAQNLVELRPHAGAFVAEPGGEALIEMFETMAELEAACASFAALRARPVDRAALLAAHEACVAATARGAMEAFLDANNRFHDAIAEAAGNRFLAEQTLALRRRLEPWRRRVTWRAGIMPQSNAEHAGIREAIEAGDGPLAARCARAHLDTLQRDALVLLRMMKKAG